MIINMESEMIRWNIAMSISRKVPDYILEKIDFKPEIALILGSCLGALSEEIEDPIVINYNINTHF